MSYTTTTIEQVVDQINRSYFLPAIQRPYVWEPEQIVALFDSLLKGYPISSFLFWELKPENRRNWEIYKFVEQYKSRVVYNEVAESDGRDIVLVLDGQQRLTSLLIGLRGSYTVKTKGKRWDNPDAWVKQRLYMDLFKDPGEHGHEGDEDNEDFGISYGLKFAAEAPPSSAQHLWIKVGEVLNFDDEEAFYTHIEARLDSFDDVTRGQARIAQRNAENLYRKLWKEGTISYFTEKNQSYDRVLDIFIRANDGGTRLSKSDLLLSMITSKWQGMNARDEIFTFVDRLNNELDRKNNFDKDFVMRSCLVISDLDHVYKVNNFTKDALGTIQANWPKIRQVLEATTRLINRFGIDRDTLTSVNALHPIAYYLSKIDASLDGSTPFEASNREKIRKWLLGALLNKVFGGSSDQTLGVARQIIKEALQSSPDFPYDALCDGLLKRRGRVVSFDENNLDALLVDSNYKSPTCFLALSLLYPERNWGGTSYHIDHIIPRSMCSERALRQANVAQEDMAQIIQHVDRLGNLQLLPDRENLEKSNTDFATWVQTRDAGFLQRNLIPEDKTLWSPDKLTQFVQAREALIRAHVKEAL